MTSLSNKLSPGTTRNPKPDAAVFKAAMRRVASTVCVLTTAHAGRRWGLTATAVCSLSAEPPSLIVCVNRVAEAHSAIVASRQICVNVLPEDQSEIAERFSGALGHVGEQRFEGADWYCLSTGVPVLRNALAAFDCTIFDRNTNKTHSILTCIAEVIQLGEAGTPLLYLDRYYAGAHNLFSKV